MNNEDDKTVSQAVMDKIESGHVVMRPKSYFVARLSLLIISAALSLLAAIFIISFVIFSVEVSGAVIFLKFGWHGFRLFVLIFPILFIILSLLFILVLAFILKQFRFAYRHSILFGAFAVLSLVVVGTLALRQAKLHDYFYSIALTDRLPVLGKFYTDADDFLQPEGAYYGTLVKVGTNDLALATDDGTITVSISKQTNYPFGNDLKVGDKVIIVASQKNGVLTAEGVGKLENGRHVNFHRRVSIINNLF